MFSPEQMNALAAEQKASTEEKKQNKAAKIKHAAKRQAERDEREAQRAEKRQRREEERAKKETAAAAAKAAKAAARAVAKAQRAAKKAGGRAVGRVVKTNRVGVMRDADKRPPARQPDSTTALIRPRRTQLHRGGTAAAAHQRKHAMMSATF
jgi:hypothetical protein